MPATDPIIDIFVDNSVPATSIMGLMMLGAAIGTSIMVEARGAQAEEALEALSLLVESKFDEE